MVKNGATTVSSPLQHGTFAYFGEIFWKFYTDRLISGSDIFCRSTSDLIPTVVKLKDDASACLPDRNVGVNYFRKTSLRCNSKVLQGAADAQACEGRV